MSRQWWFSSAVIVGIAAAAMLSDREYVAFAVFAVFAVLFVVLGSVRPRQ